MRRWNLCLAIVILASGRAQADRGSIQAGVHAYEVLDYESAVALLQQAFTESLTQAEKVTVLRTLAFAHVALDQDEQARAEFRLLLHIDPTLQLDETISPRARLVFEEARADLGKPLPTVIDPPRPSPLLVVEPPAPKRRPLDRPAWRRGWVWGTAAGATATVILIGVLAGTLTEPATARVTVAHP